MASVTGTISSTVVTLSSKADKTAVVIWRMIRMPAGCALASCADRIARYWNMPERREIDTRIIMPVSRPMVLKSIPRMASCWSSTPTRIIMQAPTTATIARLIFSDMMVA